MNILQHHHSNNSTVDDINHKVEYNEMLDINPFFNVMHIY